MFPDISQSIMNARAAEWRREAEIWRLAREARLIAPRGGGWRGVRRRLGAGRGGGPRQANHWAEENSAPSAGGAAA
jgi:hypothetical protein